MVAGSSGISRYVGMLLDSRFPQSHLMTVDEFLRYLRELDVELNKEELEFYDKQGIIRPAARFMEPVDEHGFVAGIFFGPMIREMKSNRERVQLPKDGDFQPWENYEKAKDERVVLYYHPFQFILAHWLTNHHDIVLGPIFMEKVNEIDKEGFDLWKERASEMLAISQKSAVDVWIPVVGLLMLLEEAYSVYATGRLSYDPLDPDYLEKWKLWRTQKDLANQILEKSGITIEKAREAYDHVADLGHMHDPLADWYPLLELIKRSKKQKLKGAARRAQEYYELARMVKYFIKDLTGEDMLDPDDKWDSNHQNWKPRRYGNRFDYHDPKTQQLIRDDYFVDRPSLISIVFEGDTEEVVIEKIFELFMRDYEKAGYHLYNAEGSGNMGTKNLDGLIKLAKSNQMEVYLIIDNDANSKSTLQQHRKLGNIKDDMFKIWDKDFEYDNFGPDLMISKVNEVLNTRGYNLISNEDVERRMATNRDVLMNAIANIVGKNNSGKKLDDILSKKALAEDLISQRLIEIREEYSKNQWKPKLPIEKVIHSIFQMFPFTL